VGNCKKKVLHNITVLDMSKDDTIQVLQAQEGRTSPKGWTFYQGAIYVVAQAGKVLNTTLFESNDISFGIDLSKELEKNKDQEHNFFELHRILTDKSEEALIKQKKDPKKHRQSLVALYSKIALPITTIVLVLVGVPLAITPPRVRYNRGFLFSILIIFAYYVIRGLSISFGEEGSLSPFLGAWMANIVLSIIGLALYYKKVYTIN